MLIYKDLDGLVAAPSFPCIDDMWIAVAGHICFRIRNNIFEDRDEFKKYIRNNSIIASELSKAKY